MACPTCEYETRILRGLYYWCPQCGTAVYKTFSTTVYVPSLVNRVRDFAGTLTEDDQAVIDNFERLGLRDAITLDGQV